MKKKVIISIIVLLLILLGGAGTYLFLNEQKQSKFEALLNSAEKFMAAKKYEEAKSVYKQALDVKSDDKVNGKINEIKQIEDSIKKLDEVQKILDSGTVEDACIAIEKITYKSKDIDERVNNLNDKIDEKKKIEEQERANNEESSSHEIIGVGGIRKMEHPCIGSSDAEGVENELREFQQHIKVFRVSLGTKSYNIATSNPPIPPAAGYRPFQSFLKACVSHFVQVRNDLNPENMKFDAIVCDGSFYINVIDGKTIVYSCAFDLYSDVIMMYYSNK
ncbi:hypothetical protein [Inconstantimicrobium mannanitabidum]|uniref:Uncharacterized protein n=1 Tax=Inconstantimicrobium mannanitabidum TaxID=1604901 RepID=A0ACB5R7J0_9CLOT|nr:hypothetical protein [Clostridium sp. TW13]GKX65045.1 hypothetical protein rsdtw13_03030 [Clostridium sp. TW13]